MNLLETLLTNVWSIPLVILFFGGSIFIHELGHYLAARWRGLQINRFSIGFGPRLFGWTDKRGVDWRISLIPFGGYVALPQMVDMGRVEGNDEKIDTANLPPLTFTDKVMVAAAGPFFNILFALVLAIVLWKVGQNETESQTSTTIGYISKTVSPENVPSPAVVAGLQIGDRIISIDGETMNNWEDIHHAILLGGGRNEFGDPAAIFVIKRDGEIMTKEVLPSLVSINSLSGDEMRQVGISPSHTVLIGDISPQSSAEKAGLQKGDVITHFNGEKLYSRDQMVNLVQENDQELELTILRKAKVIKTTLRPEYYHTTKPLAVINTGKEIIRVQPTFSDDSDALRSDPTSFAEKLLIHNVTPLTSTRMNRVSFGDSLTAVNGQAFQSLQQIADATTAGIEQVQINGKDFPVEDAKVVITEPEKRLIIGIVFEEKGGIIYRNPLEQMRNSFDRTIALIGGFLNPRTDIGISQLNSPLGIGRTLNKLFQIDLRTGIWLTMFLNINLALMNLLPIPVLDGGHIVFALLTKLRGRPLPPSLIGSLQGTFMIALFGLMFFTLFRDTIRWKDDVSQEQEARRLNSLQIYPPEKVSSLEK